MWLASTTRWSLTPGRRVSSTATVRRAQEQILALFGRKSVQIFPPPGPNRRDSFFADVVDPMVREAKAIGIPLKDILQHVSSYGDA